MSPTTRSSEDKDKGNPNSGDYEGAGGQREEGRVRVLLFACASDEAQLMMSHSDRMEVTYLADYNMKEVPREIERYRPRLILCSSSAFLNALAFQTSNDAPLPAKSETAKTAKYSNPTVSRRDARILSMLAKGKTNNAIAKALGLSSRTVKRTLSSLYERLDVNNRTELATRVAKLSILEENK